MSKDPAFLFYPGDYLKDTQCLSAGPQVAYDRIMCAHMKHICITQDLLNFFTKRLNDDEKSELMLVLEKIDGGYQIPWIVESISKRVNYSDSRRKNRAGKKKSYDSHMENAIENENVIDIENQKGGLGEKTPDTILPPSDPRSLYAPEMQAKVRENIFELTIYLNSKTGGTLDPHHHQYCSTIWQRLQDGYTFEQMRAIIDTQVPLWIGDAKTRQWLVPTTLFHVDYIDKYLSATKPITVQSSTSTPANIFDRP